MTFSKKYRITKTSDFARVLREKKSAGARGFFFKIKENNLGRPRFGVVVSKRVSPKAVFRNRIRRVLSEAARESLRAVQKGVDVVCVALPAIRESDRKEIRRHVLESLQRTGILDVSLRKS